MSQILSRLASWPDEQAAPSSGSRWGSGSRKCGDRIAAGLESGLLSTKDPHALAAFRLHAYTMDEDSYRLVKCVASDERHSLNDKSCTPNAGAAEQQDAKGHGAWAHKARDGCR